MNVREAPSVQSAVLGCLPDGVRCTLDPAVLLPETARRAGADEVTAYHWEGNQAFVHVRTEYGHRGWIAMQYLDWA
ncbi:MAG: SH3 domain-containing protein [Dehalococcoidia bacterium]|nr:SH3 domain-containing protein [Dehalococcoidia bacterium]